MQKKTFHFHLTDNKSLHCNSMQIQAALDHFFHCILFNIITKLQCPFCHRFPGLSYTPCIHARTISSYPSYSMCTASSHSTTDISFHVFSLKRMPFYYKNRTVSYSRKNAFSFIRNMLPDPRVCHLYQVQNTDCFPLP